MDLEDDDEGGGGDAAWMATFADLATLLLTFFVLLLSFANMDVTKFRMALGSVKDALGVVSASPGDFMALSTSPIELSDTFSSQQMQVLEEMQLLEQVKSVIDSKGLDDRVEAELSGRGVIVRVKGHALFGSGAAEVEELGAQTLDAIGEIAEKMPYAMMIEGHTDDTPIHTLRYPSNWELSTARATAAMRYLVGNGSVKPDRVGVAGYADMRPLVANDTADGRAKNRRVEFVFVRPSPQTPWGDDGSEVAADSKAALPVATAPAQLADGAAVAGAAPTGGSPAAATTPTATTPTPAATSTPAPIPTPAPTTSTPAAISPTRVTPTQAAPAQAAMTMTRPSSALPSFVPAIDPAAVELPPAAVAGR